MVTVLDSCPRPQLYLPHPSASDPCCHRLPDRLIRGDMDRSGTRLVAALDEAPEYPTGRCASAFRHAASLPGWDALQRGSCGAAPASDCALGSGSFQGRCLPERGTAQEANGRAESCRANTRRCAGSTLAGRGISSASCQGLKAREQGSSLTGRCSSITNKPAKQHRTSYAQFDRLGTGFSNGANLVSSTAGGKETTAAGGCTDLESSLCSLSAALNVFPHNGSGGHAVGAKAPDSCKQGAFLRLLNASLADDLIPVVPAACNSRKGPAVQRASACSTQPASSKHPATSCHMKARCWEACAQAGEAERANSVDSGTLQSSQLLFMRAKSAPAQLESPFSRVAFGQGRQGDSKGDAASLGACPFQWQALAEEVSRFTDVLGIDSCNLLEDILVSAI